MRQQRCGHNCQMVGKFHRSTDVSHILLRLDQHTASVTGLYGCIPPAFDVCKLLLETEQQTAESVCVCVRARMSVCEQVSE